MSAWSNSSTTVAQHLRQLHKLDQTIVTTETILTTETIVTTNKDYPIIDIGINLVHKTFQKDMNNILQRAYNANVKGLIITGTSLNNSIAATKLVTNLVTNLVTKSSPNIPLLWFTVGIHPHSASSLMDPKSKTPSNTILKQLEELSNNEKCVAIGECGLDFNRMFSSKQDQELCFIEQIKLSTKMNKPLFLHERDAHKRFLQLLKLHTKNRPKELPICVHCFTGNKDELEDYIKEGYYIGITGWITDPKRGKELFDCVKYIPLDRLMVETDAPFLTPYNIPNKKDVKNNEPSYLPCVVEKIAEAYQLPPQKIAYHTTENAKRFFNICL